MAGWGQNGGQGVAEESEPMKPEIGGLTIGRMVHYVSRDGNHHAAIVTWVWSKTEGRVNLTEFDPDSARTHHQQGVLPDEASQKPGTWHWIERA